MPPEEGPKTAGPEPGTPGNGTKGPALSPREAAWVKLTFDFTLAFWFIVQAAVLGAILGTVYGTLVWIIYHPEVPGLLRIPIHPHTTFVRYVASTALQFAERMAYFATITVIVLTGIRGFLNVSSIREKLAGMIGRKD